MFINDKIILGMRKSEYLKKYLRKITSILNFYCKIVIFILFGYSSWSQISIATLPFNPSVTNFNSYNPSSLSNFNSTLPLGWTGNVSGSPAYNGQGTGTSATGGFWGYGASGDFGLGALRSGGAGNVSYSVNYINNTGNTITSLKLSWDYKQWRYANTSGWNCSGTGALVGNSILNGKDFSGSSSGTNGSVTTTSINEFILTGLTILHGQTFGIEWVTTDISGSDNGVALDNFLLTSVPSVDGTISTSEYGTHTNGQNQQTNGSQVTYMSWDDTNLYIGLTGANTAEAMVIYLDKDPQIPVNSGTNINGTTVGQGYDNTNFAELPYRADLVMYVKNNYREYRTADGSNGWSSPTSAFGSYAENGTTREFSIPWSAIGGRPTSFNFFTYVTSASGFVYGEVPSENPGGNIGTSARYGRYQTVSTTTIGSSTPPFSRNSFVFNSTTDINSFGTIDCYDFTMNTSGRFISRTGATNQNWNIGGNLVVGNGIIYFGSGGTNGAYGATNVSGNVDIRGGILDMDQTTNSLNVTGNLLLSSGELKLSANNFGGGDCKVRGNWTFSGGTFTPNNRAVFFDGPSGNQTITGETTFDFLIVDKAAGTLILADNITCNQTLTLTNGVVNARTNNKSITALSTVNRTNGHINGKMTKSTGTGAVTRLFEIGTETDYSPVSMTFGNVSTSGLISATANDAGVAAFLSGALQLSQTKYIDRVWFTSNNGTVFDQYNATFTYLSGDIEGGADQNALKTGKRDGIVWTYPATTSAALTATATGMTTLGDFGLAECVEPVISAVNPNPISRAGGQSLTISGSGFSESGNIVTIAGNTVSVNFESTSTITFTSPANLCNGTITVTNACGNVSNSFAYTVQAPMISDVNPSALIEGISVTINGTNFGSTGNSVTIGGIAVTTLTLQSHSQIVGTVPAGIPCSGNVVVTICGQSSNGVAYTSPAPVITSVNPSTLSRSGGEEVTISGTNFSASGNTITIGGNIVTLNTQSTTSITFNAPSNLCDGTITVANACGQVSNSAPYTITAPSITGINPTAITAGSTITITGTNFGSGANVVTIGDVNMTTFTSQDHSIIIGTVPAGIPCSGSVVVTICGQSSNAVAYTSPAPVITSVNPSILSRSGGEEVTISGTNFSASGNTVTIGGNMVTLNTQSTTSITFNAPSNLCDGTIIVANACGQVSNSAPYTITAPSITGINPTAITAGSTITITGTNFGSSGNVVTIGGVNMTTFTSQSHTQIVGTVPAGIPCSGNVVVTICGQSSNAVACASPAPGLTPGASPAVCSGVTTANLNYSLPTGNPTQYSLDFDVLAEAQGFVDVTYTSLPPSPIVINVPGGATPDTYQATLQVRNDQGCESTLYNITVTVNPLPTVTFTGTLATLCVSSTMYELTGGMPAGGVYSGPGVTGTNFDASVAGANTHTLQYSYTDMNGCSNSATNSIIVLALPSAPTGDAVQEFCHNDPRRVENLTATGSNILWYANETGGSPLGGSTGLVNGQDYFASQTLNGCESADRFEVTVVIYARPTIDIDVTQPHVCLDATFVEMNFTVENGADTYSMDFDPMAEAAGFVDIVNAPLGTSPLQVVIPVDAPAALVPYSCTVMVSNSVTGCNNTTDPSYFYFYIDPDQTAGTIIIGPNTLCIGDMATYYPNAEFPVGQGLFSTSNPTIATINPTTGELTTLSDGMVSVIYTMSAGCGPVSTVSKNITVRADNTASVASDQPTVCVNTLMPSITHATTGATGRSNVMTGLPSGVTSSWSANVLTISGTPTVTGTFNYQILLTGGCGTAYATGTITVQPQSTVSPASSSPTLCVNTMLTEITHTTTIATGIGTPTGLPAGVMAVWANDVISISGTPTEDGTFHYSIPLTGGCGSVNATGTIEVILANTVGAPSSTPTLCIQTILTDITHITTGATGIGTATGLPAGVSASWASDVITISGTPTEAGVFMYSIPLTGGCGTVQANGIITVNDVNTVSPASSTPTLCINSLLTDITHTTTGATGIGTPTGLPAGLSASWASDIVTISGTPAQSGTFAYLIPLTGGCGTANASGTIIVLPENTAGPASSTPALCNNTLLTDITHVTSGATGIGTPVGLPTGVTASWSGDLITISGTPTQSGVFVYQIPLTGGCGNVSATGTITVRALPTATISGTVQVLQFAPAAPVITFTGSGGTGPYTFYYSKQENSDPATFQWTSPSGNPVTVAQSNAVPGVFTYTLLRVADVHGCEYQLPAVQPTSVVTVLMSSDIAPGMPRPINGAFVHGEVKEGVLQFTNAGPGPTVGQLTIRVSNLLNFDIVIPPVSGTYGGVNCQNSLFTVVPGAFFTTVTTNASIPAGGNLRLGFITTATGFGGANGTLTATIINGTGRDYNSGNNKSVRTFVIN